MVKLGKTTVSSLVDCATSGEGDQLKVDPFGSPPEALTANASPRQILPLSEASAVGTITEIEISSMPIPHMFWMDTVYVMSEAGEAYGVWIFDEFNDVVGSQSHASPGPPGNEVP